MAIEPNIFSGPKSDRRIKQFKTCARLSSALPGQPRVYIEEDGTVVATNEGQIATRDGQLLFVQSVGADTADLYCSILDPVDTGEPNYLWKKVALVLFKDKYSDKTWDPNYSFYTS
jgi:hypothetical protein